MEPHEKKSIFHSSPPVEPWLCYYYPCFITINPPGDKSHCDGRHSVITMMSRAIEDPNQSQNSQQESAVHQAILAGKKIEPSHLKIFGIIISP